MKVRVAVTVDIDPIAWQMEYGVGPELAAIRTDVQEHCVNTLYSQLGAVEVLTDNRGWTGR